MAINQKCFILWDSLNLRVNDNIKYFDFLGIKISLDQSD